MGRGEKTSAVEANQQISICCETLCDKTVVQEYILELERKIEYLEKRLANSDRYKYHKDYNMER